jgi:hypothetical protein
MEVRIVVGNPDPTVGNPTPGTTRLFFEKIRTNQHKLYGWGAGSPSATGLDGRLSDTSGRQLVQKPKDFAGARFAVAEVAMFNIRLSCLFLNLAALCAATGSVCADSGFGVCL